MTKRNRKLPNYPATSRVARNRLLDRSRQVFSSAPMTASMAWWNAPVGIFRLWLTVDGFSDSFSGTSASFAGIFENFHCRLRFECGIQQSKVLFSVSLVDSAIHEAVDE